MWYTFQKIFFIFANNERIKEFMIKGKEAHDEITCDAKNCSVEIFLKVLYDFVLNDELVMMIEGWSLLMLVKNQHIFCYSSNRTQQEAVWTFRKEKRPIERIRTSKNVYYYD